MIKFEDITREMTSTYYLKNKKYGNSFDKSLNTYGMISALTRISDKFNRLETLILANDKGTADESVNDTLLDMANYCIMTYLYLKKKEDNDNE